MAVASRIHDAVPWYLRVAGKLVLSRLPVRYSLWKRVGLFRHGDMERAGYAYGVITSHLRHLGSRPWAADLTAMEIGPGDALLSAPAARALGIAHLILLDSGDYAQRDVAPYLRMQRLLQREGHTPPDLHGAGTLEVVLERCGARYLTGGLSSLRELESATLDFVWSHAVLEHVRRSHFAEFVAQLRRVMKPGALASHRVDLRDHLGGGLNNLRFPERVWEAEWMARSGFYTNRIRYSEMLRMFEVAGFEVQVTQVDRFDSLPTPRPRLARPFADLDTEELCVSGFDVLLRPR